MNQLLAPRISKPVPLPQSSSQLPTSKYYMYIVFMDANYYFIFQYLDFNMEYSHGLLAPLCSDLRELPRAGVLKARMSSIAMEHGLMAGVSEDAVYAMLFAMEVSD